ncbi:LysR family transcriptional regulator [Bacillus sp. NP157]|nr:LysR family transcriptional regulator [Bacillus sp. NP157]
MPNDLLPAIAAFARVAHHASFTRAARELGVSPSALSQSVRGLEARLGVRLLDRSTRRVGVTEIGQRFLDEAAAGLGAIERAVDTVNDARESPAGLLRINLSRVVADIVVMPHLAAFAEAYPDVTVELHCDNRFLDLVSHGFDAGFRLGESLANDVVAVPIGRPNRIVVFASPGYVARHGVPRTPAELLAHRCVCIRLDHDRSVQRWEFLVDGRIVEVEAGPSMVSNDGELLLAAARDGLGIGCHIEEMVAADFASGTLVPVLMDYWPTYGAFHLYYPSRVHMPRKLRVFVDFLRDRHAT